MTVKPYSLNPLNVSGIRKVAHCPPHFFAVDFNLSCPEKKITDWIWEHLEGRFYFGDIYTDIVDNGTKRNILQKRAAFEIHSESSYFAMLLNDINKF
jgi:hypothetical protein